MTAPQQADSALIAAIDSCATDAALRLARKDRWRQVLAEAAKIPRKHLLTLEPRISPGQTTQMARHDLQLVVPEAIHATYTPGQRHWLWTLGDFIREVS